MAKKKATFAGAMGKVSPKVWAQARTTEAGGERSLPVIDDGIYPCVVTGCRADTDKNGDPYMSFALTVSEGEFEGVKLDKFHSIKNHEEDMPRLVKTIKGIGYEEAEEGMTPDRWCEGVAADINDKNSPQPEVFVQVKNGSYTGTHGANAGKEVKKVDVYINRPRSEEDGASSTPTTKKGSKPAKKAPAKKTTKR